MILYTHTFNSALRNTSMGLSLSCRNNSGYKTACLSWIFVYFCFRKADTLQSYTNISAQHSFLSTLLLKAYCYVVQKHTLWQVARVFLQVIAFRKY